MRPLIERLLDKVECEPNTGCWIWTGAVNARGYGVISAGRRGEGQLKAHRASVLVFHGALEQTAVVMHLCNTTLCVNPDHLEPGDQSANMKHMHACGRGENQFSAEYQPRWGLDPDLPF